MTQTVLVINAGSSSLKFSVHDARDDGQVELSARGRIEGIGGTPHFIVKDIQGNVLAEHHWPKDRTVQHEQFFGYLGDWIESYLEGAKLEVVGHRVVHGGTRFTAPVRIDDDVLGALEALSPLAPLHQPHNLAAIRAVADDHPDLPQVACFDTAFHQGHSAVADRFALPGNLYDLGVRRYGFHGLSYEYIARTLNEIAPEIAEGRVIVAHLGSGASMCAIHNGRSIDNTMGFTALDGLPMGTRCGALDPGVVLYLIRERGMTTEAIEDLLYHHSGMLGVSGLSSDMRDLLASPDPKAQLAVDLFVFRIVRELGALAAAMGGIDGLVFTAGIGENAPEIRARVCDAARWLGIDLNPGANQAGGPRITTAESPVSAWVIPTNEERMVALHALASVRQQRQRNGSHD
ncbi:MAG: acetate kinase [Rhodospirillaceae bacterium]|nr:acetate kinase [Rhodospirillaceae bacterium]